ncbi:MAG: ABC transporter ATP-binding protein/permease [Granulosicoccus sp.]|nr:ABC transporter ATP-binding protein/permease [Granulosicoccus sp.]
MFSFFESLVDPFKPATAERPPGDSVIHFIYYFAAQAPLVFLAVLLFGGLQAWIEISLFGFIGTVVDLLDGANVDTVFSDHWPTFAWMLFFIGVIRVLIMAMGILLIEQTIGPSVFNLIRWQSHKNVVRQSLSYFHNDFAGRIATKVIQAGQAVTDFLITLLDTVWLIILYVITTLILFFDLDWRLTLFLMIWVCIYAVILFRYVPSVRANAQDVANAKSVLTGRLVDSYSNINLVKIDSQPEREDAFVAEGMQGLIAKVRQFGRTIAMLRISVITNNSLMLIGVGYLTLTLWQRGDISVGEIAFAMGLVLRLNLLANRFLAQINGLFRNLGQAQDSMRSVAQPVELLDKPGAVELDVKKGLIQFRNVCFDYGQSAMQGNLAEDKRPLISPGASVIKDFSLTVRPGEKIGLVGPSGAGKSTLVNLMLRLYELDSGVIEIDGQAITDVTQSSLRAAIGMVSQDTALLHRSIRDNIAFAKPDASEERILAAASKAQALEFLENLQDGSGRKGLDAYVGERGVKLSGGQRQRIAIARVLLKDAPILVLDEATSALDSEIEAAIQASLQELMKGKTVLAIAHRLSTIAAMDRLVVIEAGRIVETGTHDELVRKGQRYASLWSRQSGGFIDSRIPN